MKIYIFVFLNCFNLISSSNSKQDMNEIVELQENVRNDINITIYYQHSKEYKAISGTNNRNIIDIKIKKKFYFRFEVISDSDYENILYYEMILYYNGINQNFKNLYKKHFEMTISTDYDITFNIEFVVHKKNACKIYFKNIFFETNICDQTSKIELNSILDQSVKARFFWFQYCVDNFKPLEYNFPSKFFIGHRGSGKNESKKEIKFYENTIPAFKNAFRNGIKWIEFDVQVTSDYVPIIFHDFMIKTDETAFYVGSLEFLKISKICERQESGYCNLLDLNSLFNLLDESIGFNIEIKYPDAQEMKENGIHKILNLISFLECIFDVVKRYPSRKMFFSSFHMDVVIFIRLSYPNVILFYLTEGKEKVSSSKNNSSLEFAHMFCQRYGLKGMIVDSSVLLTTKKFHLKRVLNDNLLIFTYGSETNFDNTVNDLWESNITAIITDDVENASNRLI